MDDKATYVTKEGLAKLQSELEYLQTTKRKDIAGRIASAKELGDLSENAEYSDAKEEQGLVETRILELQETLRNVQIVSKPTKSTSVVIGSTIVVKNDEQKEFTYTIVGSNEADPSQGKISNESPIGKAFLGLKSGESVEIDVPKGKVRYTITKIS